MDDVVRVAILVGDEVIAVSDDYSTVHIAAAMLARQVSESRAPMQPIAEGRREALRRIAVAPLPAGA